MLSEQSQSEIRMNGPFATPRLFKADLQRMRQRQQLLRQERAKLRQQVRALARSLEKAKLELGDLARNLVAAQEEERRRIARELHDGLGQCAALIKIQADRLAEAVPSLAERTEGELTAIRRHGLVLTTLIREVSHQLYPSLLTDIGLCAAMHTLVDDFRAGGRRIDLQTRCVKDPVPPDIAGTLYRILQEALHNAAKHAVGACVFVVLQQNSKEFRLTVRDEGPGFDPDEVRSRAGLGLLSMRERARLAGGSLLVRSALGKGTVLIARVPAEKRVPASRCSGRQ